MQLEWNEIILSFRFVDMSKILSIEFIIYIKLQS